MRYLLAFAILSLLLPIRWSAGGVLLRPFEVLVVLALAVGMIDGSWKKLSLTAGFMLLIPYFTIHVLSAFSVTSQNGVREALQIGAVVALDLGLVQVTNRPGIRQVGKVMVIGLGFVLLFTIAWHLSHGIWAGWKRLADSKLAFTFFTVALGCAMAFTSSRQRRRLWGIWFMLAPILVLSGERKAVLIYLFLSAALLVRGRIAAMLPALAAGLVGLILVATMISDPYLNRQIETLIQPDETGNYEYVLATGQYARGDTPSNVQRAFAWALTKAYFVQHPLVGIGTNEFNNIIDQKFSYLPDQLRLGIHGEFQRILTENGLIGLVAYLLVWIAAWLRLRTVTGEAKRQGLLSAAEARLLPLLFFIPCALYVGTEASGTRAFVILSAISLLPNFTRRAMLDRLGTLRRSGWASAEELSPAIPPREQSAGPARLDSAAVLK
jgi:hypothetical protein